MNVTTKLATLAPVGIAVVAVTQLHWVVSHFATLGLAAGAVTVGAAIVTGRMKGKGQSTELPAPERDEAIGPQAQAYLAGIRAAGLPQGQPVQDPTWASQRVAGRIERSA